MKSSRITALAIALIACMVLFQVASACDCDYHSGGCTISKAPGAGSKCKCSYSGGWTCSGREVQCSDWENCPGDCTSYKCCAVGGGDCGGY